ncbi:retrotransposon hot spot (RHS) protein, partial [Trypanosoma conorhini]
MWRSFVRFHVAMRRKLCVSIVPARAAAVRPRGVRSIPQPQLCVGDACARWPPAGGVRGVLHPSFLLMAPRRVPGGGARVAQGQGREQGNKQPWTLTTSVDDVLLGSESGIERMTLNDFIRRYVDPDFVLEGRNVMMGVFARRPERYVTDPELRGDILSLPEYQLLEDARKLMEHRVNCLEHWKEFPQKDTVTLLAKGKLDSALAAAEANEKAKLEAVPAAPVILEGFYDSVFNARWSHVLEFPEGEGNNMVVRMEVKAGEPTQSWVYKAKGMTFELDAAAYRSRAPRPRLLILSSEQGWPCTLAHEGASTKDFYVNFEVERVWRIVQGDLNQLFENKGQTKLKMGRRLLIGTPGIGKSMAAGSYLLYKMLRHDDNKLQVVVYCFGENLACVFDKTTRTVTEHEGESGVGSVLKDLVRRGMQGYIIFDVAKEGGPPPATFLRSETWGMIVVSSPKLSNYNEWEKQVGAMRIIMNCPDELDVKAMCAWETRDKSAEEQTQYWTMVEERMLSVGPILRYLFNKKKYRGRVAAVKSALTAIRDLDVSQYFTQGNEKPWYSENPSHRLVKIVRVVEDDVEVFYN